MKRVHYFVQFANKFTIIIIDHVAVVNISTQIILLTTNVNKFNLRSIKTFQYLLTMFLEFRHKLNKKHIVSNALFRFQRYDESKNNENELKKLNAFHVILFRLLYNRQINISSSKYDLVSVFSMIHLKISFIFRAKIKQTFENDTR